MKFSHKLFYTVLTTLFISLIVIFLFSAKNGTGFIFSNNESSAFMSLHLVEDGLNSIGSTTALSLVQKENNKFIIKLDNNTNYLNAEEIEIFFDPDHFSVEDLIVNDALCEKRFLIKRIIDNEAGRLFFQCGTVNPLVFSNAVLSEIIVIPKNNGTSTIRFGLNSNLYIHDGLGTKADISYGEYVINNMFY